MKPIQAHIEYLRHIKGYSENTCKAYEKALHKFARAIHNMRPDATWRTITRKDIDNFIFCLSIGCKHPSTINLHLAAISSQFRYFQREGLITYNPCKYESRQKVGETIPNIIPTNDLRKAFEHATGEGRLMLGLLISTGMRIGELLSLTYQDIDTKEMRIKVRGKGNKERIVYTNKETLQEFPGIGKVKDKKARVFEMTEREARYMIWEMVRPYTMAKQVSPHAIRHTFATWAAKAGCNSTMIAKALGHNDLRTSQKYINMAEVDTNRLCFNF